MGDQDKVSAGDALSRAASAPRTSLARESWQFIVETRKWWLLPVCATLALFALLVLLAGSSAAPLVYTLY